MAKKDKITMPGYFAGAGKRLKLLREQMGYEPKQMAALLGITVNAYYKNENDLAFPSIASLKTLVEQEDVALDWFLLNRGPRHFEKSRKQLETHRQALEALKKEKEEWDYLKTQLLEREKELEKQLAETEQRRRRTVEASNNQADAELREQLEKELTPQLETKLRETLTKELREQLEQAHARALKEGTADITARKEIKELLAYMDRAPLLYHEVMAHFHRLLKEHGRYIEESPTPEDKN